jgi:phosphoribosylformimino-5-aminoimidazole carboxamide ribotide isomerase
LSNSEVGPFLDKGSGLCQLDAMLIIPSIDLIDGKCIRLLKGDYRAKTVYSEMPHETAKSFERAGARWIHVVDLDAAQGQGRHNRDVIREIRGSVSCRIEVGGGIRTEEDVEEMIAAGIDRLVLGTILVREPERVAGWVERYGQQFAGGIDALQGTVRIKGWEVDGQLSDENLAFSVKELGIETVIYTSISQDGTLSGPDIQATNRIAERSGLSVILSGGIGSSEDVQTVYRMRHPGVKGVITGKAIFEGRVDLRELIAAYQSPDV